MKAKGIYVKRDGGLFPSETDANAVEGFTKLNDGDRVLISYHRPRNPDHHRLAFGVFNRIAEATGKTVEQIYNEVKFLTGRFDWIKVDITRTVRHPDDTVDVIKEPKISFESMSQDEFQKFWDDARPVIYERYFPGIDQKAFDEIMNIIAPGQMDMIR
jgi:hypothetical protein